MASRLTGSKKAAILLLALGEEAASEVIKNLSPQEIEQVTKSIQDFGDVTPGEVERVTNEFYLIAEKGKFLPGSPETKTAFLKKVLAKGMGDESAKKLVEGIIETPEGSELERLKWHDPTTIAEFLDKEHPQVVAVILANLGDSGLTRQVLEHFQESRRQDILARMVRLREISLEWIEEIEAALTSELSTEGEPAEQEPVGINKMADVMSAAPPAMEKELMGSLSSRDPALAGQIRERLFDFDDFIRMDNFSIQKVLGKVTNEDLVLALRTADERIKKHFFRNLSDENVRQLEEAIQNFQPTRISSIEEAQKRLCQVARELNQNGEIRLLERKRQG